MIVPLEFTVVARAVCTEPDLADESFVLQVAQRVVDGGERDAGQEPARMLEDLIGREMLIGFADDAEYSLALFRKS